MNAQMLFSSFFIYIYSFFCILVKCFIPSRYRNGTSVFFFIIIITFKGVCFEFTFFYESIEVCNSFSYFCFCFLIFCFAMQQQITNELILSDKHRKHSLIVLILVLNSRNPGPLMTTGILYFIYYIFSKPTVTAVTCKCNSLPNMNVLMF